MVKRLAKIMNLQWVYIQDKVNDKIIQISILDCCGHDKFELNTPYLFKNASMAILVYAINDINYFNELDNWYNILKGHSYKIEYLEE